MRRVFRVSLYLLTQSPDIHVHAARGHKALRSPDGVEQLVAGKHAVGARGQVVEQTELERAQRERFALARHAVGGGINQKLAHPPAALATTPTPGPPPPRPHPRPP